MSMYSRDIVEAIKDRSDIVDLIGGYVSLKRAGSNYNGLCPFHSEKTPSFTVFPDNQSFFCFGCEAGGDAFTFIMRTENLDYKGAIEFLAKRGGVELPADSREERRGVSRKRVFEMNLIAARFWRECLFDPNIGRVGMEYLTEKRGLPLSIIRRFGIGYAPNDFNALTTVLTREGFTPEEIKEAFLGTISQKNGRVYDLFRDRVMFPVIDNTGNVIAFSGRDVGGHDNRKYVNSSDTPAFQKRRNLFALNFAKNHCAEQLILCEGNIDVVSLHAAGFENAVASLGTALTDEQARIMAKYTKQVVLAYDSDEAGQRAAHRAMGIFAKVGLDVRILQMQGAKDPDEYIKKFGAERFRQLIKNSRTGFEFKLQSVLAQYNLDIPDEKIKAAAELCAIIARVYSSAEREVYIHAVADRLGLREDSLRKDVESAMRRNAKAGKQQESQQARLSAMGIRDKVNPEAAGNIRAAAAEETILGLLLLYAEHRKAVRDGVVPLTRDSFVTAFHRNAFTVIMTLEESDGGFDFSLMGEYFTVEEMGRLARLEQTRRALSENGTTVLRAAIDTLAAAKERQNVKEAAPADRIQMILAGKRKNINRGSDDDP
ncbi:MAG: DNA primase [Clostridia bacterium]|nr:DNA primase [Clostridia bacterium]